MVSLSGMLCSTASHRRPSNGCARPGEGGWKQFSSVTQANDTEIATGYFGAEAQIQFGDCGRRRLWSLPSTPLLLGFSGKFFYFFGLRGEIRAKTLILLGVDCETLIWAKSLVSGCEYPEVCLLLSIFLVYQFGLFHYANLSQVFHQWNERVGNYLWPGLLTSFAVHRGRPASGLSRPIGSFVHY